MPNASIPIAPKVNAPAAVPTKSSPLATAPAAPSETSIPSPAKIPPVVIVLGALSAGLLIASGLLWLKVGAQATTIAADANRANQYGTFTAQLELKAKSAEEVADRLRAQLDDTVATSERLKLQVSRAAITSISSEDSLNKARNLSNTFQSQMEEAKVSSIRRQGEAEVARTEKTVAQTQLGNAETETARLRSSLDQTQARCDALQLNLKNAQDEIERLTNWACLERMDTNSGGFDVFRLLLYFVGHR